MQVPDDLVADEQVASVVEVKTVFEDELFEKFWRDHPKYVDHLDANAAGSRFAKLYVIGNQLRFEVEGYVVYGVLGQLKHVANFSSCFQDFSQRLAMFCEINPDLRFVIDNPWNVVNAKGYQCEWLRARPHVGHNLTQADQHHVR